MKELGIIYLTPHFSLFEMCYSETAELYGWDNFPDWESLINLNVLCQRLEHVRDMVGLPIIVNSGFRSLNVNSAVGGEPDSFHLYGRAADIKCSDMDYLRKVLDLFNWTEKIDYKTFIHVAL